MSVSGTVRPSAIDVPPVHEPAPERQREVQGFADVNVAWLAMVLVMAGAAKRGDAEARARAIFAAVSGAQLYAPSRSDVSQFDGLIESYRAPGLIPA